MFVIPWLIAKFPVIIKELFSRLISMISPKTLKVMILEDWVIVFWLRKTCKSKIISKPFCVDLNTLPWLVKIYSSLSKDEMRIISSSLLISIS